MTDATMDGTHDRGDDSRPARENVAATRATVSSFMSLVEAVQDNTSSDDEVVAVLSHILSTRRVALGGELANRPLRLAE